MRALGTLSSLTALLALSACLTDPYGVEPEVKIDPEKLEDVLAERETDTKDPEDTDTPE